MIANHLVRIFIARNAGLHLLCPACARWRSGSDPADALIAFADAVVVLADRTEAELDFHGSGQRGPAPSKMVGWVERGDFFSGQAPRRSAADPRAPR